MPDEVVPPRCGCGQGSRRRQGLAATVFCNETRPLKSRSALHSIIAHRLPALNQVSFLVAPCRLTRGAIMGVNVSGAVSDGVIDVHMTLQPLVHASSLRDVYWNPASILALLRIDEVARQCL